MSLNASRTRFYVSVVLEGTVFMPTTSPKEVFFVKEADELCKSLFQMAYFSQHVAQSWNYVDLKLFDDLGLIISCLKT